MKNIAFLLMLLIATISLSAQTSRTWTGSTSNDWNTASNWSPSGVPSTSDHIVLNNGSLTNMPLLDASYSITNITVSAGTLDLNGYTLTITGTTSLTGGNINNGIASFNNSTTTINGTTFGAKVNITATNSTLSNSTFNKKVTVTRSSCSGDTWTGNTFNDTLDYRSTCVTAGLPFLNFYNSTAKDVFLTSSAWINYVFGSPTDSTNKFTFASGKRIKAGTGGFSGGVLSLRNVAFSDSALINLTIPIGTINIGSSTFKSTYHNALVLSCADVSATNTTFNKKLQVTRASATGQTWTGNTFNDTLDIRNSVISAGYPTFAFLNSQANEDIFISGTAWIAHQFGSSTDANNKFTFAAGKTVKTGPLGLSGSTEIRLSNAVFQGTGDILLSVSIYVAIGNSSFTTSYGNRLKITCGGINLAKGTFSKPVDITSTGYYTNNSYGGNTFNDTLNILLQAGNMTTSNSANDAFNGDVFVSNTGTGYLAIGSSSTTGATLASGKKIQIGSAGFNSGQLYLRKFTQTGATPQSITLGGASTQLIISNTSVFNATLALQSPILNIGASTFNKKVTVVKTGSADETHSGGNTFNDTLNISTQAGGIIMAGSGNDVYNGDVYVSNTNSGFIALGSSGGYGCTLATGKKIIIGSAGFNSGQLYLRRFTQSGTTPQSITLGGTSTQLIISNTCIFNGKLTLQAPRFELASSTFNKKVEIIKTGASNDTYTGGNTFNDTLDITTHAGGIIITASANDAYNGDVYVSNTGSNFIALGSSGSYGCTLAMGKKLYIGSAGFNSGILYLRRFTQNGSTAQSITLGGSTTQCIINNATTFNGNFTIEAPNVLIDGSTFNGSLSVIKNGSSSNTWYTANTYNGNVSITNTGTGYINMSNVASGGDVYNGNATFTKSSTGDVIIAGNASTVTFKGDVTLNNISSNQFTSSQVALFTGTNSQTLTQSGGALNFGRVTINKASNNLTLGSPLTVNTALTLTSGKIITTGTNILNLADNATASGASNTSYVQGPIKKTGNDAFTFPTGKNNYYRPIGIAAPTSAATVFTAEYLDANQTFGTTADTSIANLSDCEHWTLTRSGSSDNVNVTLSWNSASCNGAVATNMRAAGWNGSQWTNYGNGSRTGNATAGTVTTGTAPTAFNAFTLGNKNCTGVATITPSGATSFCSGGSVLLTAPASARRYGWLPSGTAQAITASATNSYIVTVADTLGCVGKDTVNVTVWANPIANAGIDTVIVVGDTIKLNGSANGGTSPYTYDWSPGTALSSTSIINPDAYPTTGTNYIFRITDSHGCIKRDTMKVWAGVLSFSIDKDSVIFGDTVRFTNTSTGFPVNQVYYWHLGGDCFGGLYNSDACWDTLIGIENNVSKIYLTSDTLLIKLKTGDAETTSDLIVYTINGCGYEYGCGSGGLCNLVCNAGFELVYPEQYDYEIWGSMFLACPWESYATADLYHQESTWENSSVPYDGDAIEDGQTGNITTGAFAGLITYAHHDKDMREYITQELKDPLINGINYEVGFYTKRVQTGFMGGYATNIGAAISNNSLGCYACGSAISYTEDKIIQSSGIIEESDNWVLVSGYITGDNTSLNRITIGRFNDVLNNSPGPDNVSIWPLGLFGFRQAYYLLDDIYIKPVNEIQFDNFSNSICFGGETTVTVKGEDIYNDVKWYLDLDQIGTGNNITLSPNVTTTYLVTAKIQNCPVQQEFTIYITDQCCIGDYMFFDTSDSIYTASEALIDFPSHVSNTYDFSTGYNRCTSSTTETVAISGQFLIDTDFSFVNANVVLAQDAFIAVPSGKTLTIQDSWLHACTGNLWDKIHIASGGTVIVTSAGATSYMCGSIIEDASRAVHVYGSGVLTSNNYSTFNKNLNHIGILNNTGTSGVTLSKTKLQCDGTLLAPNTGGKTVVAISITYCNLVTIGDVTSTAHRNYIQDCMYGIKVVNSNVNIYNNDFTNINCTTGTYNTINCGKNTFPTAIWANNNNPKLYTFNLNVGDAANYRNWISNATNGIHVQNGYNVNIKHNTLSTIGRTGINLIRNIKNVTLTVDHNIINNAKLYGIKAEENAVTSLFITENDIENSSLEYGTGIYVRDFYRRFSPNNTFIFDNDIDDVLKGIIVEKSNSPWVYTNTINTTIASSNYADGIVFKNCLRGVIKENTITGDGMALEATGVKIETSQRSTVMCNSMTNTGGGLVAWNDCSLSTIADNRFEANFFGVLLATNGVIGPQGLGNCTVSSPHMNIWNGSDFYFHVYSYQSPGPQSNFTFRSIDSGTPFHPSPFINQASAPGLSMLPCTNSISIPSYVGNCSEGIDDDDEKEKLKLRIMDGDTSFVLFAGESDTLMRMYLLDRIDEDSLLMLDDTLADFVAYHDTTQLGLLHKVGKAILAGNKAEADSLNELVISPTGVANAYNDFYRLYITTVMGVDSLDTIPDGALNKFKTLAEECPYQYGPIVWQARAIYKMYSGDTTDIINDCEIIVLPEERRNQTPVVENTNSKLINVYPNPTTGNVNIVVKSTAENVVVQVYNSNGQLIEDKKLAGDSNIELPLSKYATGIYTLRVIFDGKESKVVKVIKTE